jgi:hypothetical protein
MKSRRFIFLFILCVPIPLVIASGFLIRQSIEYKSANRKLILQNDSLKSVLIEMNQQLKDTEKAIITAPQTPRK